MGREAGEIICGLVPGSVAWDSLPGGLRGLSSPELAFVMAGLSPERSAILRGAELDDHSGLPGLITAAMVRLSGWDEIQAIKPWPTGRLQALIRLAYIEVTDAGLRICHVCQGRQLSQDGRTQIPTARGVLVTCNHCEGTGKQHVSAEIQAELIGMDLLSWKRVWRRTYERTALRLLSDWLESAKHHVCNRYYDN